MNGFDKIKGDGCREVEPEGCCELSERSFFPPEDGRVYVSGIKDIRGGDCFAEHSEWFWNEYEDEIFDCNN